MPEKLKRQRRQRALRESDRCIVPQKPAVQAGRTKPSNVGAGKATRPSRDPDSEPPAHRGRHSVLDRRIASPLERIRITEAFNNVFTLLTVELLWYAFRRLKRGKASGVDHVTVEEYEEKLQDNLLDLETRLHRGTYRPQPACGKRFPKGMERRDRWASLVWKTRLCNERS